MVLHWRPSHVHFFGTNPCQHNSLQITVAMLCIAHAFESGHSQSYVIAHKLLIHCFEVNCLHKYPIIGKICLIYSHFQQNCPYFSSYVTFYCIEICLPNTYFTSSLCVLKRGFPKFGLFFETPGLFSLS